MKTIINRIVVIGVVLVLSAGCGDVIYPIWDFPPWNIGIIVRNSAGEDLLDPNVADNILSDDVVAEYNGEPYVLWDARTVTTTRYIPAEWFGLRVGKYWFDNNNGEYAILFGEFGADTIAGHHGETITIHWGDGTSDEIKFDLYVTYRKKGTESTVHRRIWLNGKFISDEHLVVEIVR